MVAGRGKKTSAKKTSARKTSAKKTSAKKTSAKTLKKRGPRRSAPLARSTALGVADLRLQQIESLRAEVSRKSAELLPRWNANPEDVQRSVAQLVLALVEFLRRLLERQAIRRMDADTLAPAEVERVGVALMRLEEMVNDLAARFGLAPEDLNLDLGPLGRLS